MMINEKIYYLIGIITDILFPKSATLRKVEAMGASEILAVATHSEPVENAPWLQALFKYTDPLAKQIVWEIKYRGNKKIVTEIGKIMSEKISETIQRQKNSGCETTWIIIPIPSSQRHMKERGFNQTELVAQAIIATNLSKKTRLDFSYRQDILLKIKSTPSQASLEGRGERLKNLIGAFSVRSEQDVREKNIILIDDVITTGATMKEASRALTLAGAKSVIGFAIAH